MSKVKEDFQAFKGSRELTSKRVYRNVFTEGDCYFSSGDLLELDSMYNVYFRDRTGDTFRYHDDDDDDTVKVVALAVDASKFTCTTPASQVEGENVSTTEVSNVVSSVEWIADANVYGVKMPGDKVFPG